MSPNATTFLRLVVEWAEAEGPERQVKVHHANAALAQMTDAEKLEMQQTLRDYDKGNRQTH